MIKTFKVIVRKCKTREGKEFNAYKAVQKDGSLIDCKFRRTLEAPDGTCMCTVDSGDEPITAAMNIDRKKEYPVLWIARQPSYEVITRRDDDDLPEF